ncbi:hypothetical protein [Halopiger goleimassiliensis]|uniref:hypothetical protein n=1 Tax=Halopiger goleimassiliensis TaxID=1293048 RepID=UPI0006783287|nr:hypothetical protein [Halopiger goleimassiliensis]
MCLDKHAAERRRFARLLGTDGELGCGLPIGSDASDGRGAGDSRRDDASSHHDDTDPSDTPGSTPDLDSTRETNTAD